MQSDIHHSDDNGAKEATESSQLATSFSAPSRLARRSFLRNLGLGVALLAPGAASNPFASSDHPVEHTFRQWMSTAGNLKEYHAKTRENIQQLFRWVESLEQALPVERSELWSEGEENFEARLDAIAAQR